MIQVDDLFRQTKLGFQPHSHHNIDPHLLDHMVLVGQVVMLLNMIQMMLVNSMADVSLKTKPSLMKLDTQLNH